MDKTNNKENVLLEKVAAEGSVLITEYGTCPEECMVLFHAETAEHIKSLLEPGIRL